MCRFLKFGTTICSVLPFHDEPEREHCPRILIIMEIIIHQGFIKIDYNRYCRSVRLERNINMSDKNEKSRAAIKTSIGGQALIEGIMMRGPARTAMAVRRPDGSICLEEWQNKQNTRPRITKLPIIRGVFNFVDSMIAGYKTLMRSAEIAGLDGTAPEAGNEAEAGEEEKKAEKEEVGKEEKKDGGISSGAMTALMTCSAIIGVVLAVVLFKVIPETLYELLTRAFPVLGSSGYGWSLIRAAFTGILKIIILVAYMALISLMKDIKRTFMYHGAEHKTIFCYEKGLELTVENVREQRRFHPRCGTSFLILMVLVSIFITMFIPTHLVDSRALNVVLRSAIGILLLPLIMGVGYELLKLAGRHDNLFTRIISAPGMWLQHITTREPDDSMIECAIAAVKQVIPNDGSDRW